MTLTRSHAWIALAFAATCAALATRDVSYGAVGVVVAAGFVGFWVVPAVPATAPSTQNTSLVTLAGMAAIGAASLTMPSAQTTRWGIVASVIAAIGEEAFFRRGMYAVLERFRPLVAIAVPALAFALIHVPHYGWPTFGINLAAGLVFGWQRWASGTWLAPAATHTFANLVAAL